VTRGDQASENGLVAVLGGPDDVVARVKPVFDDFGKATVHCGPLGAEMTTKIARNIVTYGSCRVAHEAGRFIEAASIDRSKLLEVIETADPDDTTLLAM
jgi:3-hydroxyisobutyrate dehydrogenase-like beta-hydroxyacid dehydrogenase